MFRLAIVATLLFSLLSSPVQADGEDEAGPSMELLEFLADWSVDDGEWLDLAELEKMNLPEQEYKEDGTQK
jgi:hypothetical protein